MMGPQEEQDLAALKEAMRDEKITTYSWLISLAEAKPEMLRTSGYGGKTNAEAVLAALQYSKRKIDKMLADHVKKYPDK